MDKQYDKRIRRSQGRPKSVNTHWFTQNKKILNWKIPGHDGIHGFWLKKFTSIHDRLTVEMNRCTRTRMDDQRKDHIDPEGTFKGTTPNNYRPITYIPMMWKILTAQIREEIYNSLTSRRLFPEEQKGCCTKAQESYFT